ncbi:MAG: MogA/MoaB family molybdenum cofactor biosynthesis protein [Erysipelotrichaceae bacterium]|nr:MogA/MoaB family molybdenum cofactor biosynthesis protein [Erysipelotrichaceae bacterium]MDY5251159.1 MogA/MoaB family molybdenum cofactor biosynthesis protein [Erysipelotrichaceae bacterium]
MKVAILTASDSRQGQLDKDLSGQVIEEIVQSYGYEVIKRMVISDDKDELSACLRHFSDDLKADLILTTGGTGFSPRDNMPEATLAVIDKQAPGIAQAMLFNSLQITPKAMLSRAVAGIRKQSLIINLPGSPKAVRENLEYIMPALGHGLDVLAGNVSECARK